MATKDHPEGLNPSGRQSGARRAIRLSRATALVAFAVAGSAATPMPAAAQQPRAAFLDVFAAPATIVRRREATDKLAANLTAALNRTRNSGTWGVIVVSLSSGDTWDPLESTCRHASLSIL